MSRLQALQPSHLDAQPGERILNGPDLLTQVQVCARLGISDETWMRWRKAGRVPEHVTLPSGRKKWRVSDIDRMAGLERVPSSGRQFFGRHAAKVARLAR